MKLYKRYNEMVNELKFVLDCAVKRTDRYKGQITKDYLKKRVPAHLVDENISQLFLHIKNKDAKDEINKAERIFTYKGTSLIITEAGKSIYNVLIKITKN